MVEGGGVGSCGEGFDGVVGCSVVEGAAGDLVDGGAGVVQVDSDVAFDGVLACYADEVERAWEVWGGKDAVFKAVAFGFIEV